MLLAWLRQARIDSKEQTAVMGGQDHEDAGPRRAQGLSTERLGWEVIHVWERKDPNAADLIDALWRKRTSRG